jgi:hypothetical protein
MGAKLSVKAIKGRKCSPLRDRCPQCCVPVPIAPERSEPADDGASIHADYRCPYCKHTWFTTWNAAALG